MVIYIGCTGGFGYGTVMTIRKVFVHPEFKKNNQKYDVALVYTKKKIDSSEIIKLASRNVQLSDKGTITGIFFQLEMKVVRYNSTADFWIYRTKKLLCTECRTKNFYLYF
jgi:hypothetical protein